MCRGCGKNGTAFRSRTLYAFTETASRTSCASDGLARGCVDQRGLPVHEYRPPRSDPPGRKAPRPPGSAQTTSVPGRRMLEHASRAIGATARKARPPSGAERPQSSTPEPPSGHSSRGPSIFQFHRRGARTSERLRATSARLCVWGPSPPRVAHVGSRHVGSRLPRAPSLCQTGGSGAARHRARNGRLCFRGLFAGSGFGLLTVRQAKLRSGGCHVSPYSAET